MQALHGDAAAEVLGVGAAEGQAVAEAGDGAGARAGGRDDAQRVVGAVVVDAAAAAAATIISGEIAVLVKRGEAVAPDVGKHLGGNASAAVTDADRDARGVVVERPDGVDLEGTFILGGRAQCQVRRAGVGRLWGDGDHDRLTVLTILDRGAEGVLQQLSSNVL